MGLKRVTGNNKKTQKLVDTNIVSAIKSSNQTNPRSGGTTLVKTPQIAPTMRAEHHNTANVHFVVSGQMTLTNTPPQSIENNLEIKNTLKEISEQLTLPQFQTQTLSLEDSLANLSQSLGKEKPFQTLEERYFLKSAESLGLKELRTFGLKMLKDYCLLHIQNLSKSGTKKILMKMENLPLPPKKYTKLSLELKDGFFSQYSTRFGNWGMTVNGNCLIARITEFHKTGKECSLSQILETDVDPKYFLSGIAVKRIMSYQDTHLEQSQVEGETHNQTETTLLKVGGETQNKEIIQAIDANYGKGDAGFSGSKRALVKVPQGQRVKNINGTSFTLNSQGGGQGAKTGLYQVNPSKESGNKEPYQQNRIYADKGLSPALNSQLSDMYKVEIAQSLQTDGQLRSGDSWGDNKPQSSRNIRRLTPIECERLQGFPDNWTKYGIDKNEKQIDISDTQRYKCCGNAVTTNVITIIGKKLMGGIDK